MCIWKKVPALKIVKRLYMFQVCWIICWHAGWIDKILNPRGAIMRACGVDHEIEFVSHEIYGIILREAVIA